MSRAAVSYNSTLSRGMTQYTYDVNGGLTGVQSLTGLSQWRMLIKPASTTTPPTRFGRYTTPTAYSMSWGQLRIDPGEMYYRDHPLHGWRIVPECVASSGIQRVPTSMFSIRTSIWNELEIKALNKLRNSQVNVGVAIAEAKETEHLLTSSAKRISKANLALPKSIRNLAKRFCGVKPAKVPQQYLEVMYGWNPLMADIVGACESLSDTGREGFSFQVKSSKRTSGSVNTSIICPIGIVNGLATYNCDAKVRLRYILRNVLLAKLSSLGLVNPLEIVWERVPYSFVVDWFIPIGNWLSALTGDFGYDFDRGCRSEFCSFVENGPTSDSLNGVSTIVYSNGLKFVGKYGYFKRTKYTSSPVPGLYFKSPVSAHHIAEALSLLATSFRR